MQLETCDFAIGDNAQFTCEREKGHSDPHVHRGYGNYPFMYATEDPRKTVYGYCHDCYAEIVGDNKGTGVGSALHCAEHLGPVQEAHRIANSCKACGFPGPHQMRNYSMMWHEADIHCGSCGAFVRYWDAG
jgi:hypothetical protein